MPIFDTPSVDLKSPKWLLAAAVIVGLTACAKKEEAPPEPPPPPPPAPVVINLADVEVQPEFPGGSVGLMAYLEENIDYSHRTEQDNLEGVVQVAFVVGADGKVRDVEVLEGLHQRLDAMAREAVQKMPAWTPGTVGGEPVSVSYELPIVFSIPEQE